MGHLERKGDPDAGRADVDPERLAVARRAPGRLAGEVPEPRPQPREGHPQAQRHGGRQRAPVGLVVERVLVQVERGQPRRESLFEDWRQKGLLPVNHDRQMIGKKGPHRDRFQSLEHLRRSSGDPSALDLQE